MVGTKLKQQAICQGSLRLGISSTTDGLCVGCMLLLYSSSELSYTWCRRLTIWDFQVHQCQDMDERDIEPSWNDFTVASLTFIAACTTRRFLDYAWNSWYEIEPWGFERLEQPRTWPISYHDSMGKEQIGIRKEEQPTEKLPPSPKSRSRSRIAVVSRSASTKLQTFQVRTSERFKQIIRWSPSVDVGDKGNRVKNRSDCPVISS